MRTKPKIQIDLLKVESLAANGLTQEQIALALGISESTLYLNKRENEDFAEAIKRGQAKGVAVVTNKLMEAIKDGNMTGMIFFLKCKAGWKDTQVLDHTSSDGSMRNTINISPNATPAQIKAIIQSAFDDDAKYDVD